MKYLIAVVGAATGQGQRILQALADQGVPSERVMALDYGKYENMQVPYGRRNIRIRNMMTADLGRIRVVLLCLSSVLTAYVEDIIRAGAVVIDCTGIVAKGPCALITRNQVFIPSRNPILNPTDLTVALARVLGPIHQAFPVRSAEITALLSAGIFGEAARQALQIQSQYIRKTDGEIGGPFRLKQAFNLIVEADPYLARQTTEQIKGLFGFSAVVYTCLTPVFFGEAYAVTVTTREMCSADQMRQVLAGAEGCRLLSDEPAEFPPTGEDCADSDLVLLSRLRAVPFRDRTWHLWALCNSKRCGSADQAARLALYLLS